MFADKSTQDESKSSDIQRRASDRLRIEAEARQRAEEELRARAMVSLSLFPIQNAN